MTDLCAPTFAELATSLGFSCEEAGGLVEVRNPSALENWTLPVLEVTVVFGAVLALVLAVVRLRRHGDPTNLVLWFGATAYLFLIEPPLYFPAAFGIEEYVDTMFAHNVFTVEFLWGRLPLYIVAIYPLMATLAFEIVRMLGVFRRYGVLVGAVCVGFVHHAFYEIFDHLGPQLRWWHWSVTNPVNQPMFDAVPLPSVVVFAALWPMSLALCVQFFVGRHVDRGRHFSGLELVWRTVVIGLLASLGTFVLPLPATVLGMGSTTVRGVLYAVELVVVTLVASVVLVRRWVRLWRGEPDVPPYTNRFVQAYSVVYLCVMAFLWAAALPDFLRAVDGVTSTGDPVGNLWYTLACFVVALLCVAATFTAHRGGGEPGDTSPAHERDATHAG
ncbi:MULTISPECIES: hypothetical protein [Rhodococcus]|uniref:hypothetical protein n=1 Tax=Rhodococcus TaxID=1827 RepID=UPI00081A47E9|nr:MULTISPECIES: hypothetical protein [Rhodococcus]ANZ24829.1 hypothetical protein A4U64_09080 [Rhodococcus sp. WB1]MBC2588024.1 hypothetical protein [Rhodococcus aetherivorans]QRI73958.1 hypothetical protein JQ505_14990 [Rhodococcus aetherivorans]QSE57367.1 hypothetical protein JYA75_16100 [Rhodococcus sp. PSBB066]QSE71295.1 hypothetical protein JYA91_11485 [Rhodococcus sp. PSBB049]